VRSGTTTVPDMGDYDEDEGEEEMSQLDNQMYAVLPSALAELTANQENLSRIADWCASTYLTPGEDRRQVYSQTQNYLKDALLTVTQHMCNAAACLAQTVELQTVELEGVDAMVRLIENRLAYQKEQLGRSAVSLQVSHREFVPKKDAALEKEAPSTMAAQLRTTDGRINFAAFERVGDIDQGACGGGVGASFSSATPPPPPDSSAQWKPPPPPGGDGGGTMF
tara:strand:+ start:1701 stop:2369 length:669 start_codon:yes stop_codon:yes gene_type:complete